MSIQEAIAFRELQHRVDMLAAQVEQLAAPKMAAGPDCATCAARREGDRRRQRLSRQRHVTDAPGPVERDCSAEMP